MLKRTLINVSILISLSGSPLIARADDLKNSLTIYSTITPGTDYSGLYRLGNDNIPGYALVRKQLEIDLKVGDNKVTFTEIPSEIDPTTITFKSMSDPTGTQVVDQSYRYDLRNYQQLLEKYRGKKVTVEQNEATKLESYTGKLLSTVDPIILEDEKGDIISLNAYNKIHFPKLETNLTIQPTLMASINAIKSGKQKIETTYQTKGLSWWADYNAILNEKSGSTSTLELSAWASIVNKSGISYQDTNISLVAGELNQNSSPSTPRAMVTMKMSGNNANGFTESSFSEYHLYSLGRKVDLPEDSIKQLELFPKTGQIPVKVEYLYVRTEAFPYYGQPNLNRDLGLAFNTKVDTYIKLKNSKSNGLGIPLPAGRVRINKFDSSENLQLIGETTIPHTPLEQDLQLKLGAAFDITAEGKQLSFSVDEHRKVMEESFEITIKNQKDSDILVTVMENLNRGLNWSITANSEKFVKKDAQTIEFRVPIKKGGEAKMTYSVRYTW